KLARRLGIEQRTVFAGWHENAYAWMALAALLVLSSDFEGFGRVIVEALAVGTPVVSTLCPSGPDEILTGEHSQWLVPRNDPEALAAKITQALRSPPSVDPSMVDSFDIEQVVDRYLTLPPRTEH
ncbi:MAG: glycosyltransferase, partial [Halomonadaceae bacterium]